MIPSRAHVEEAYHRCKPYVYQTPVLTSSLLNEMANCQLFFKCENFQKMGAFKIRGAINAMLQLSEAEKENGVVTHSSGNFAQAIALAGKILNIKSTIVMPRNAPEVKKNAVKSYGGNILECNPTTKDREQTAFNIADKTGAVFLHPSNNLNVILGQGTAAIELLNEQPELDYIITPVGGGGLIAGSALAVHYFSKKCNIVGGEPTIADDAYRSLKSGRIESNINYNTIADGLRTQLGDINFPIIANHVRQIVRVSEIEISIAMKLIWERMKIVVEPSSAVAFAAILSEKEKFKSKNVGVILSGGNVDLRNLPF